jgi:hypothetical protein
VPALVRYCLVSTLLVAAAWLGFVYELDGRTPYSHARRLLRGEQATKVPKRTVRRRRPKTKRAPPKKATRRRKRTKVDERISSHDQKALDDLLTAQLHDESR